jgi:hypothetical protein
MRCNPCAGTGFVNTHQLDDLIPGWSDMDAYDLLQAVRGLTEPHDVAPCDCCGTGDPDQEDPWHGVPGEHYNAADPEGKDGPYAYNGGLCECH